MPAQAGIQRDSIQENWIPAFAGMTHLCLRNSPTPQLFDRNEPLLDDQRSPL